MILRVKHKGSGVLLEKDELRAYLEKKFHEINVWASGVITALVVITFICIFFLINANIYYYYILILFPIAGRYYLGIMVLKWLSNLFRELIEI
jgi:hypothetical protein